MRIPIVSITGRSGSSKTTLVEKLISELVNRHYKVATVKHDAHSFEFDKKGAVHPQQKLIKNIRESLFSQYWKI